MKNTLHLLVILLVATTISLAQGDNQGGFTFRAGISSSSSSSDNSSTSSIGYNVGGSIDVAASRSVSFSFSADYNSIPFDGEKFINEAGLQGQGYSIEADPASVVTLFASLRGYFSGNRYRPSGYIILGVGYFGFTMNNFKATYRSYTYRINEIKLTGTALQLGFGVDIPLGSGALFFIEGSLAAAFVQSHTIPFVPARSGVKVNV